MRFRLLGPVEIATAEGVFTAPRPRSRAVLAYLLLSANRLVTTDSIVDAVWGPSPPATARNQIQADVSAVRRALREAGCPDCLVTSSSGYRIAVAPQELDLTVFTGLLAQSRTLAEEGGLADAAAALREALGLWRGAALGETTGAFVEPARATLAEQRLGALENLAELDLRLGRHEEVAAELGARVGEHPLREGLVRALALALYRCGRPADALAALRQLRDGMAEEFGVDPSAATSALEVAILRSDVELDLRSAAPRRHALPGDVAGFAGRDRELAGLDAAKAALVTVIGPGGIGKTALALHWAHQRAHLFPDGVLYVDLRGFSRAEPLLPTEALSRLLYQLGVAPEQIPAREDFATDLFRAQVNGKRLLILLDNVRNSEQARPMLPGTSTCMTVITSRTELSGLVARDGAIPVRLGVLAAGEAVALLAGLLGESHRPLLAELAQLCGYVPLALRIAAAALLGKAQDHVRDYLASLRSADRLGVLEIAGDDELAIAGTFELSYALLDPAAQHLFRMLSLVPGPDFTAEAAAALADLTVHRAGGLLRTLAAAHLVEDRQAGRYGFHDLLRLYAASLAEAAAGPPLRQAALARLYRHYLDMAAAAAKVLYPQVLRLPSEAGPDAAAPFDGHSSAIAWLDSQRANLVAAVAAGAGHGRPQAAWLLADTLRGYFFLRMFTVEWNAVAQAALAAAEGQADSRAQAAALLSLADLHWRQGDYDHADEIYGRAVTAAVNAGWLDGLATATGNLGGLRRMQGRLIDSAELLRQSLALNIQSGRLEGQSVNLGNLAIVYLEIGDYEEAERTFHDARVLHRKLGSRTGEAVCLSNLGEVTMRQGDHELAVGHLEQALQLHRELGDRAGEAATLSTLAEAIHMGGDTARALELAQTALVIAEQSGDRRILANCLRVQAGLHHLTGEPAVALPIASRSVRLARQAKHRYIEARALLGLARVQLTLADHVAAREAAAAALDLAGRAGYSTLAGEASELLRA